MTKLDKWYPIGVYIDNLMFLHCGVCGFTTSIMVIHNYKIFIPEAIVNQTRFVHILLALTGSNSAVSQHAWCIDT